MTTLSAEDAEFWDELKKSLSVIFGIPDSAHETTITKVADANRELQALALGQGLDASEWTIETRFVPRTNGNVVVAVVGGVVHEFVEGHGIRPL